MRSITRFGRDRWQGLHSFTNSSMSSSIPGHQTNDRASAFILTMPGCPWCSSSRMGLLWVRGTTIRAPRSKHSCWIEAIPTSSMTAGMTVRTMRGVFATHGVPKVVASDNGPSFTAYEFTEFLEANGIQRKLSAPYHPATNGLAERAMQTVKQGVNRQDKGKDLRDRLSIFLLQYRITPQTTTGDIPSQLLVGRRLQTRLDRIFPDGKEHAEEKQQQQTACSSRY